jgi:hypothetical protein
MRVGEVMGGGFRCKPDGMESGNGRSETGKKREGSVVIVLLVPG